LGDRSGINVLSDVWFRCDRIGYLKFGLLLDCTLLKNHQYILPLLALREPETLILLLNGCSMEQIVQLFKPIAKSITQQFEGYFADFYT